MKFSPRTALFWPLVMSLFMPLVILSGCFSPANPAPDEMPRGSNGSSGLSFKELLDTASVEGITPHWVLKNETAFILLLEIDPSRFTPRVTAVPQKGIAAADALATDGLALIVGSGYTTNAKSLNPVGLLKQNGQQLSPLEPHGYTRILGFTGEGLAVVHRSAYQPDLFNHALQLGPGIIEAGALDISERDLQRPRFYRSFIGLCDAHWIAGVSLAPTNLYTLGRLVLDLFKEKNWQCTELVNLAGDQQAVLALRSSSGEIIFHGDIHAPKASFIGFSRNEAKL